MSDWTDTLLEEILRDRQKQQEIKSKWQDREMSMLEYLELGLEEPWIFDNAAQRIWRVAIEKPGIEIISHDTHPRRARALGLPKNGPGSQLFAPKLLLEKFYGVEETLHYITLFFHDAMKFGEKSRQILFLRGDVGTGKSQIVDALRDALIGEPVFIIKDCPVGHSPLWATPYHYRQQLSKKINYPIPEKHDVCPVCSQEIQRINGEWEKLRVITTQISYRRNQGLAIVPPFDPNTMGSEVLIGDEKVGLMHDFPSGSPELMNFIGALDREGGLVEVWEIFKGTKEMLHMMLAATQDQRFPSPGYRTTLWSDFIIIAHSNLPEVERFRANSENRAFVDRVVDIPVRYTLSCSEETKIYRKIIGLGGRKPPHFAPGTERFMAQFAILSRLKLENRNHPGVFLLLDLLNGDFNDPNAAETIRQRRKDNPNEGFHGLSTRFMTKAIANAMSEVELGMGLKNLHPYCVNLDDALDALRKHIANEISAVGEKSAKEKEFLEKMLDLVDGTLAEHIRQTMKKSLIQDLRATGAWQNAIGGKFEEFVQKYWNQYVGYLSLLRLNRTEKDLTGVDLELIKQIEDLLNKEIRPEYRKMIEERLAQDAERKAAGLPSSTEELAKLRAAITNVVINRHGEELLREITEWMTKLSDKKMAQVLESLPQYCKTCLVWALRKASSPYKSPQEELAKK